MKVCTQCKKAKDEVEFSKKGKGYQCRCKACTKIYNREHYRNNRKLYNDRQAIRRKEITDFIRQYKTGKSCLDCGIVYPYYIMEFDHLKDKKYTIAWISRYLVSNETLQKELDKCELVCANCHRERTFKRRGLV